MEFDLHANATVAIALDHTAAAGASEVGNIIDTIGYESVEFVIMSGTITTGTFAVVLEDGDNSGLSDAAAIASQYRLGALPTWLVTDDDTIRRVGSISKKRYQRLTLAGASTPVAQMSAVAILSNPKSVPTAEQAVT